MNTNISGIHHIEMENKKLFDKKCIYAYFRLSKGLRYSPTGLVQRLFFLSHEFRTSVFTWIYKDFKMFKPPFNIIMTSNGNSRFLEVIIIVGRTCLLLPLTFFRNKMSNQISICLYWLYNIKKRSWLIWKRLTNERVFYHYLRRHWSTLLEPSIEHLSTY